MMRIVVFMLASTVVCAGEDAPIEERIRVMRGNFSELREDLFSAQKRFDTRYEKELKKLEDQASNAGNLDLVLGVRGETEAFRGRGGKGPEILSDKPELARLQKIYTAEGARISGERELKLAGLESGYRSKLMGLRAELTKAGKIPEALAVDAEVKWLDAGGVPAQAPAVAEVRKVPETPAPPSDSPSPPQPPARADSGGDFDQPIPGYALGEAGKVNGFGNYANGKALDMEALGELDDVVEVNADRGAWWNVLSESQGEFFAGGSRRMPIAQMGRGEKECGGWLILEDGTIFHNIFKKIDPSRFGGGDPARVACIHKAAMVLKKDGTVRFIEGTGAPIAGLDAGVSELGGIVEVDASHRHFFALTEDGKVLGWRIGSATGARGGVMDLAELGDKKIAAIASHRSGVCVLDREGKVWWVTDSASGGVKVSEPKGGALRDIRRIWAGGDCGVALDKDGKLHAWAADHGGVGFVEKIEALQGFKDLAVMDLPLNGGVTHALWIE